MPNPFGVSFDPSANQQSVGAPGAPGAGPKPAGSPLQQAIQFLSLRMPRVAGAHAPVDPRLLAGSPQAAGPSPRANAVADSVLRSIVGPEHAQGLTVPPPENKPVSAPWTPGHPEAAAAAPAPPAPSFGFPQSGPSAPPPMNGGAGFGGMATPAAPMPASPSPMPAPAAPPPAPLVTDAPQPAAPPPTPAPLFSFTPPGEQRANNAPAFPPGFESGLLELLRQIGRPDAPDVQSY